MTDAPARRPGSTDAAIAKPQPAGVPAPRRYHVPLSPAEVIARLCEQDGVKAFSHAELRELDGIVTHDAAFTLGHGRDDFVLHAGPPADRGQSATGILRLLYLRGRLIPTRAGTTIELRFELRRPRWAKQRYAGLLALASLAVLWAVMAPGQWASRAPMVVGLLLVLTPVLIHDLRRGNEMDEHRRALLNLIEHTFGPIQIDEPHPDEPYRRRMLEVGDVDDDERDDPDEDDDDD